MSKNFSHLEEENSKVSVFTNADVDLNVFDQKNKTNTSGSNNDSNYYSGKEFHNNTSFYNSFNMDSEGLW